MKILFDGYLMKRGHDATRRIKNRRFTGNSTDLPVDSYLMVI
jgi:hypothetical protein